MKIMDSTGAHTQNGLLSVVIPLYNEAKNIDPLFEAIHDAFRDYDGAWELILVDDGSTDDTLVRLQHNMKRYGNHVQIIPLQRNFGQTAAMQAGIDYARGNVIATMDGDLQNDPHDIPRLADIMLKKDLDLVVGWRQDRQDNLFVRKIPSWIANALISSVTGVHLHDYGCSLKVYRASMIKKIRLYGEMHRFIPAWSAMATSPKRIAEEVVNHQSRQHGKTKYGLSRTFRVVFDLVSVYFFMRYRSRPGHFFSQIALVFGSLSTLILGYLAILKFVYGQDIGSRPLLLIGVFLFIATIQLIITGVITEMLSRTYYEATNKKSYLIREESLRQDPHSNNTV